MGTSKSYTPSSTTNPSLGKLSGFITQKANGGSISNSEGSELIRRFIEHAGGRKKVSSGDTIIHGKAGLLIAKNISSFLNEVNTKGIDEAFIILGLSEYKNKTLNEILNFLVIALSEDPISLDDTSARNSLRQLLEEMTKAARNAEDLENILQLKDEEISDYLIQFFGIYLFEAISVKFDEKLLQEKNKNHSSFFKSLKQYILAHTRNFHKKNDLRKINWKGKQGKEYISNLYYEIIGVFI